MAGFSDYLEAKILNWLRGTAFGSAPSTVYVGLFSNNPNDDNSGTEVTTTIRPGGRVAATFAAPSGGAMSNDAEVDFGTAAGGATVTHFAIFDASSAGNQLMNGALSASQNISAGNDVSFAIGDLDITVD